MIQGKLVLTDLNSEFFFSSAGCYSKVKELIYIYIYIERERERISPINKYTTKNS